MIIKIINTGSDDALSRILAIFPHPDDETFSCGGTLAHFASQGVAITLVCATKGEAGKRRGQPPFVEKEELPFVRENELYQASKILGIQDVRFLNLPDKKVKDYEPEPLTRRIVEIIKEIQPDVIITFGPHGEFNYHPDHRALSRCVVQAFHINSKVKKLYFPVLSREYLNPASVQARQEQMTKIDISHTWHLKIQALQAHLTQFQQEKWVWNEAEAKSKLPLWEGFVQYHQPYMKKETNFF